MHVSQKSHVVNFLPSQLPERRQGILLPLANLQVLQDDDGRVFSSDKWKRYLERPAGNLFDVLTYPEFYQQYHESSSKKFAPQPPYDEVNEENLYLDIKQPTPRKYRAYNPGHNGLWRCRSTPTADVEDACAHLLMLHVPWRTDCDTWLQEHEEQTYFDLAERLVDPGVFNKVAPLFRHQGQDRVVEADIDDQSEQVLTAEQRQLLNAISVPGLNLVEGVAGTGKSTLLRALRKTLRDGQVYEAVVLAPTGIAAENVGGWTIHSYFGSVPIGGQQDVFIPNLFNIDWNMHLMRNRGRQPFFILDEFSMILASTLDEISRALDKILTPPGRHSQHFGGAPVCAFGDFGQLGPVVKTTPGRNPDDHDEWAFYANTFCRFTRHRLVAPIRHDDQLFFAFLTIVRRGAENDAEQAVVTSILNQRDIVRVGLVQVQREALTCLSALRAAAQDTNNYYMEHALQTGIDVKDIVSHDNVEYEIRPDAESDYLENETGLPRILSIWVGAQVIVTMNLAPQQGIINGTVGKVIEIDRNGAFIRITLADGRSYAICAQVRESSAGGHARRQIPLRLAYGLTIHKAQSLTLPRVLVDLAGIFCSGQAYVAMSRVRRLSDLYIAHPPANVSALFPHDKIKPQL
jgi:hypothetical protein